MRFLITGLNHRTAPVEVRERLAFSAQAIPEALDRLRACPGLKESAILSTCNRVEILATAEEAAPAEEQVETFLAEARAVDPSWIRPFLYRLDGREAIRHLFRVASSLDSLVVGEPQILGQLKSAYAVAKERGAVSGELDLMFTRAFSVAKRVRTETEIGESAVSVSYAAVELAREIFGSLGGRGVLVVGAGKMAEAALQHLRRAGVGRILVTNRTRPRAEQLAAQAGGAVVDYEGFSRALPEVDIVITSSGATGWLLTPELLRPVVHARRHRPMFLIDIAVPRNIDPAVNALDGIFLYDIDDLEKVVHANAAARRRVADSAEQIVDEEVERMLARLKAREVAPTIISLQEQFELVRQHEWERARGKLAGLSPEQEQAVEALTRGIVNKLAHGPIAELRRHAGESEGRQLAGLLRRIFRLGG
jgi:glutamyl-tRNA reductase